MADHPITTPALVLLRIAIIVIDVAAVALIVVVARRLKVWWRRLPRAVSSFAPPPPPGLPRPARRGHYGAIADPVRTVPSRSTPPHRVLR